MGPDTWLLFKTALGFVPEKGMLLNFDEYQFTISKVSYSVDRGMWGVLIDASGRDSFEDPSEQEFWKSMGFVKWPEGS